MKTIKSILLSGILLLLINNKELQGQCSTFYESEVIENAQKTIELNDVSYALKLIKPEDKKEIQEAFDLMMKVKVLSPEAKVLSEKYFLETLARIHQSYDSSFPWMLSALFFITTLVFSILYFRKK
jgi:hypothetical protein